MTNRQVARGLGWFGIGLGLAELAAPQWLSKQIGVGDRRNLIRAMGAREVLAGVGVLAPRRPTAGLWARVAGDAVDIALLGAAMRNSFRRGRVATALAMVLGVSAMDALFARRLQRA
jgi:CBS-domain-containing membrane protein